MKKNPYTEEHIFGNTTPYALKWESIRPDRVDLPSAHFKLRVLWSPSFLFGSYR
jgi:hypothetical protein